MQILKYILVVLGIIAAFAIIIFILIGMEFASVISFYFLGAVALLILTGFAVHFIGHIASSNKY